VELNEGYFICGEHWLLELASDSGFINGVSMYVIRSVVVYFVLRLCSCGQCSAEGHKSNLYT
jgi:hypothetical protein